MKFQLPKIDTERLKELRKKIFQDRYEKILEDLKELESENPTDMRVKQKIAETLFRRDRVDEAVEKYKEIAAHFEKEAFVLKAIKAYHSILKIKPDLVDYNLKLAGLYVKLGMTTEAANQYRIAINHYATLGDSAKTLALSKDLVKIDPSNDNRAKLAEIYQTCGMIAEAVKQYEILAGDCRAKKNYDKLLYYCELILPHQPDNKALLKDVCILYLRKQKPDQALRLLDHYKMTQDPVFAEVLKKAKLMQEVLRRRKG